MVCVFGGCCLDPDSLDAHSPSFIICCDQLVGIICLRFMCSCVVFCLECITFGLVHCEHIVWGFVSYMQSCSLKPSTHCAILAFLETFFENPKRFL